MADTLKFGPEWLRALSHGSNVGSPPSSPSLKFKLADYRYGREEMLVLFNKDSCQKPDNLEEFSAITLEKPQLPLAFLPFSEEEQRNWNKSVNSDVVLRIAGRSPNQSSTIGLRGSGPMLGRGGSVDRGRGRGVRSSYYGRNIPDETGSDYLRERDGGPRSRIFDRSHSQHERTLLWDDKDRKLDKGFISRGHDENGGLLSRKDNWRLNDRDETEEESGWRTSKPKGDKWGRANWRNHSEIRLPDFSPNSRHDGRPFIKNDRFHEGHGDQVPEWSKDDDYEEWLGTFDSSGAFRENQPRSKKPDRAPPTQDGSESEGKDGSSKDRPVNKEVNGQVLPSTNSQNAEYINTKDRREINNVGKEEIKSHSQTVSSSSSSLSSSSSDKIQEIGEHKLSNSATDHLKIDSVPKTNNSNEIESRRDKCREANVGEKAKPVQAAFDSMQNTTLNLMEKLISEEKPRGPTAQNTTSAPQLSTEKVNVLPVQHEHALKWLYRDPQGKVQGPFLSEEMLDWFNAGYFNLNLVVRRGCDEKFLQLGDLMNVWGRCPFTTGQQPPPITAPYPLNEVANATKPENGMASYSEEQLRLIEQQVAHQQILQNQQAVLRQQVQIMNQLRQTEGFDLLTPQQQKQLFLQYLVSPQIPLRSTSAPSESQVRPSETMQQFMSRLGVNHPMTGLFTNAGRPAPSIWDVDSRSQSEPVQQNTAAILSNIEELERRENERREKEKMEEERRLMEAEHEEKRLEMLRQEGLRRKQEEDIIKQEEERRKKEELRQQEEERLKLEDIKRQKDEAERKQQEREREQLQRLEELKKKEELRRKEELRQAEELQRQEDLRMEKIRKLELLKQHEEQKRLELERVSELERQEELERKRQMETEFEEKQQALLKMQAQQRNKQGSAWGMSNSSSNSTLTLAEIQKLQEEREQRERLERQKLMALQQKQMAMLQQQQEQMKGNNLPWANVAHNSKPEPMAKSLAEIQKEEEERASKVQKEQAKQQKTVVNTMPLSTAGVWGNASAQLTWNSQKLEDDASGFWDEPKKPAPKNSADPTFPTLANNSKPQKKNANENSKTKSRSKKEQESVMKIFEAKSGNLDDFTLWCTKALSNQNHSVDVPTFIGFLKDIESPFEVQDYVKSFLGEGKEAKDFAKQFLLRRSKMKNHLNTQREENMWGPAPAIMPNQNKSSNHDGDGKGSNAAKKKKKGKMQKLDSSVLGFTVYADPTRINVGEIDHGDVVNK